jgi:hypothetical protein
MPGQQHPVVGDRVGVPWGLDVLEGLVLRTYETGAGPRAVVSVDVPGTNEDPQSRTITLPIKDLLPVEAGHAFQPPGSWVNEYQFAKAVQEALARAVDRLPQRAEVATEPRVGDRRPDAIVRLGDHLVVVEVKATVSTSLAVEQLDSYLREVRNRYPGASVGGMLVFQSGPTATTTRELHDLGMAAVSWNTPRDDQRLTEALTDLLEAA